MTATTPNQLCPDCGAQVPVAAPEGLCPRCLALVAVDSAGQPAPGTDSLGEEFAARRFLGDYELLGEVARGGMGIVFKARQLGVNRVVALKVLAGGAAAGREFVHRFHNEAASAARLEHPHIVPIYEFGEHEGTHFLAMRFLEGGTLQTRVAKEIPAPAEAARTIITLASAVEHAHRRGVLHRDLKPGNVLLDGAGAPHVADFGLARVMEDEDTLTLSRAVIGTAAYLAPEVAGGGAACATVASDIYGLGAILYELLTGRPPFVGTTVGQTLRAVQDAEPIRPGQIRSTVPLDLETICLKCLEKDPARRYATAQALADDLGRFLNGEPVHARPVTGVERAWRWCRRKPALATLTGIVLVLVLIVLIGSPLAVYHINQSRQAEIAQRRHAESEALRARQSGYASDMLLAQQALAENNLGRARELLENYGPTGSTTNRSSRRKEALTSNSTLHASPAAFDQSLVASAATDLRGWEWYYLASQVRSDELLTLAAYSNFVYALAFSPDGKWLVSGSTDGMSEVWDTSTRQRHIALPHSRDFRLMAACFSPDGKLLATGADLEKVVRLWRVPQFDLVSTLTTTNDHRINSLVFSRDSQWLASGRARGVCLWNLKSNQEFENFPLRLNSGWSAMAFTPHRGQFLFGNNDGTIAFFDLERRRIVRTLPAHSGPVLDLQFTPDGQRIFSTGDDGIRCWSASDLSAITLFTNKVTGLIALAPNGRILAAAGSDRRIHLLDAQTGELRAGLRGHEHWITALAWSPDGRTLASGSADLTVRLWSTDNRVEAAPERRLPMRLEEATNLEQRFGLSPDGHWLTTAYTNGTFSVWHTDTVTESARQASPFGNLESMAVSSEARWLALGGSNGVLKLAEWNPYREIGSTNLGDGRIRHLQFSPDGNRIAAYTWDHLAIRVLTVPELKTIAEFPVDEFPHCLRFTPDGSKLAAGWWDKYASVLDIDSRRVQARLYGHRDSVMGIAISQDGQRVATASRDGTVRLWDGFTGRELHSFSGQFDPFHSVTFSPAEDRLFAGTGAGMLHVWNLETWQEVMVVRAHQYTIAQLGFLPDKATLISAGHDRIRVWRSTFNNPNKP